VDHVLRQARVSPEAQVDAVFRSLPAARLRAALIGAGIQESRTPRMHEAEGARLGLDYAYSLIDYDALDLPESAIGALVEATRRHGFAGLNVTHPFKEGIIHHLDGLSEQAAAIGAVNTVVFAAGKAVGHNTDCWGFAESFRSTLHGTELSRVLLLGAGGAGKAVAHALSRLGAGQVMVYDIDRKRAAGLADSLNSVSQLPRAIAVRDVLEAAREASGIVNTTPVGMAKYPGMPVPAAALRPGIWVADAIYFPAETELLRTAAAAGCRIMPGKGMAVFQAVKAFELITSCRPDSDAMFRHFEAAGSQPSRQLT
jgi:shikimate dehydrogenase